MTSTSSPATKPSSRKRRAMPSFAVESSTAATIAGVRRGRSASVTNRSQMGIVLIIAHRGPACRGSAGMIGIPRETRVPMSQTLHCDTMAGIARLRLNRPELHNAFDAGLIAGLTAALERIAADPGVRVLVLEAAGASFSAGADLNWMRGMAAAGETENREDSLALARLMRMLDELPKPTIARVQGAAFGGGVGLVACCDIAIGVPEAKFGLTESKLGLLPAVISP